MRRPLILLAAALALGTATAGCGAEDIDPSAIADAAEATKAVGGLHMTATATSEEAGETTKVELEGDTDLAGKRAAITAKVPGGGELQQVMIGTTMYMHIEGMEKELGAEWLEVDLQEVGEEAGFDFASLQQTSSNPADQLDYLRATADLEDLGKEDVDGVETTHYKATIDLRRYPDTVDEDERAAAKKSIDKLIELGMEPEMPTEVWIDEKKLVRRQKLTFSQSKPKQTTMHMDMRFSDFGKKVRIGAPRGDVKDVTGDIADELG